MGCQPIIGGKKWEIMKILFINRDPASWKGGDGVQLSNTMKSLEELKLDDCKFGFALDNEAYDLVHMFNINFAWTKQAVDDCNERNIPYVISAIFYPREYNGITFDMIREMVDGSKATICLSTKEADQLVELTGCDRNKLHVIPNGVDKKIFTKGRDRNGRRAITIGRVENEKGQQFAVEACIALKVPIVLVGNTGILKPEIIEKFDSIGAHFVGEKTQEEIVELLHQSSIYICSSLSERQSLGVLEAAACGLPIVDSVYNLGASFLPSSEIVEPQDNHELQLAIMKQLQASDNYDPIPSWEDVARKVHNLYL